MSIKKHKKFKNIFIEDFKAALFSKRLLVSILLVFIVFIIYALPERIPLVSHIYLFNYIYSYTESWLYIVIVASICYGAAFAEDYRTHFYYFIISRDNIDDYLLSKYLSCILSGAISVTLGCTLTYIFFRMVGNPGHNNTALLTTFNVLLENGNTILLFFSTMFAVFMAHSFWAAIGLISSAIYPNKFIAYSAGYLLAFVINNFSLTFLPDFLSPVLVGRMRVAYFGNLSLAYTNIFLLYLILNVIGYLLFKHNAKRRILYG